MVNLREKMSSGSCGVCSTNGKPRNKLDLKVEEYEFSAFYVIMKGMSQDSDDSLEYVHFP